jgi:signal transduction histidine kinase
MKMIPMRWRNLLLVLAMALLAASALDEFGAHWRRALFFAHFGAFLLWQPLVAGNRRLGAVEALLVAGGACLLAWFLNPWVMLVWTATLAALVGGRGFEFAPRAERWFHLAALTYLVGFMFAQVLPDLLPPEVRGAEIPAAARNRIEWACAVALSCLAGAAWRISPQTDATRRYAGVYDPVHSLWMLVLLLLVGFFGIALMTLTQRGYVASIAITLVSVAAVLMVADALWGRGAGSDRGSLSLLVSRYLLSYGIPYEVWLDRLARMSREERDPARFFDLAVRALGQLAPLAGARWGGAMPAGGFGATEGGHVEKFEIAVEVGSAQMVFVNLYMPQRLSAAFAWHVKLLIQIAVQLHAAKARAESLRIEQYLHAVHEAGARVTHDVKNLLQSLDGVVAAAGVLDDDRQLRRLVERQLPEIGRRLAGTLMKLQQPLLEPQERVRAFVWWEALRARHDADSLVFEGADMVDDPEIPQDLFAGVADNLIQNALQKRAAEPGIRVRVGMTACGGSVSFCVEDSGSAIPGALAPRLFRAPVASRNGLGIGLYQVSKQAAALGFALELDSNVDGCVRLCLRTVATGFSAAADPIAGSG